MHVVSEVVSAGYGYCPSRFSALLFAQGVKVSATFFKQHFSALAHFALSKWVGSLDGKYKDPCPTISINKSEIKVH